MNINFWVKTTKFKIFGKTFFTKEEICNDKTYEDSEMEFVVNPEYYKKEFEIDNNNRKKRDFED